MKTRAQSRAPRLDRSLVERIARAMADIVDGDDAPTLAFYCEPGVDDLDVGIQVLRADPASALVGFRAPPSWWCLGTAARGRAHRCAATTLDSYHLGYPSLDDPDDAGRAVRLVNVVCRSGDGTALAHFDGDADPVIEHYHAPTRSHGRIDDALRLALGLPTPPPAVTSVALFAVVWLDRLLARALDDPTAVASWHDAVCAHPVLDHHGGIGAIDDLAAFARRDIVRAGELLARARPWERLLRDEQRAGSDWADDMAWYDVGAYSRLRLSTFGDTAEVLDDLEAILPPPVARDVRAALVAWGLAAP